MTSSIYRRTPLQVEAQSCSRAPAPSKPASARGVLVDEVLLPRGTPVTHCCCARASALPAPQPKAPTGQGALRLCLSPEPTHDEMMRVIGSWLDGLEKGPAPTYPAASASSMARTEACLQAFGAAPNALFLVGIEHISLLPPAVARPHSPQAQKACVAEWDSNLSERTLWENTMRPGAFCAPAASAMIP